MKEVKSVLDFDGGSIIERINYEMQKVLDNIADANTDEKPREISVKIQMVPANSRKQVVITAEVNKKIRPTTKIITQMAIQSTDDGIAGVEVGSILDGQIALGTGEVFEQKVVKFNAK